MRIADFLSARPMDAPTYTIEKRLIKEKLRTLAVPSPELASLLQEFNDFLREACKLGKGLSPIKNAMAHKSSLYFFQTDIKDAFPSINPKRLAGVLCHRLSHERVSYDKMVSFLTRFCFTELVQGLPQGSPASPVLFELYCQWYVDRPIKTLIERLRAKKAPFIVYTRYVDDITVSSRHPLPTHVSKRVKEILRGAGFVAHSNKTTYLERERHDIVVTGVRILRGGKVDLSKKYIEVLKREHDLMRRKDPKADYNRLFGLFWYYIELQQSAKRSLRESRRGQEVLRLVSEVETTLRMNSPDRKKREPVFPKAWLKELRDRFHLLEVIGAALPKGAGYWDLGGGSIEVVCPLPCGINYAKYRRLSWYKSLPQHFLCKCARGDVIAFTQKQHGLTFIAACVRLAKSAGLALPKEYYRRRRGTQLELFHELLKE